MAASEELGIKGIHNFHFFVEKPERSFDFYTRGFGWNEVAKSSAEMEERSGQQSKVYAAGDIDVLVSTPQNDSCRAARYLRRHPAGVGSISFEVEDIDRAYKFLVVSNTSVLPLLWVMYRFASFKKQTGKASPPALKVSTETAVARTTTSTFLTSTISHVMLRRWLL